MPSFLPAQPRFTDVQTAQDHLSMVASSAMKVNVLTSKLCAAEFVVERYCRRKFAPEPALADPTSGYQRRLVSITSTQAVPVAAGTFTVTFNGVTSAPLSLPLTASTMQSALRLMSSFGANVVCSGGPLPTYPISITFAGTLVGVQPAITVDPTGLGVSAGAVVADCGFDSAAPVLKRFTTRGKTVIRVPDLRVVDSAPDPRVPAVSGVMLYSRRLLPNQYYLGYNAYALGGADESIGSSNAEPSTEITLGYGYGTGYSLAAQFSYVLPLGYMANDLQIVGRWGWQAPPADIVDAVYATAGRLYNERNAAYSDQMITQEGVVFQFFKQMPASVQATLDSYRVSNVALI